MSKKKYPSPVKVKFKEDFEAIKKGAEHTFGAATAADFMRKGIAWPSDKKEEAKLPETIRKVEEDRELAEAKKKG